MGGGSSASGIQKQAANDQSALNRQLLGIANSHDKREQQAFDFIRPLAEQRAQNGLSYFPALTDAQAGIVSRGFNNARAQIGRQYAGSPLPSGARDAALRDLSGQQAVAFDEALMRALGAQDAAKTQGIELLRNEQIQSDPAKYFGLASQGNASIFNADPLTNKGSGIGGILGGLGSAALGAIPF